MTQQRKVMSQHGLGLSCAKRNNRHQLFIGAVFTNDYNRPDFDHFRYFMAPEVTNKHTAFFLADKGGALVEPEVKETILSNFAFKGPGEFYDRACLNLQSHPVTRKSRLFPLQDYS